MSELSEFRAAKDESFRHDHQSPLQPQQRAHFDGLAYYDENRELALELTAEPFAEQAAVEMQTSTGEVASYVRWARIHFEVDGEAAALTVYRDAQSGDLFLPFQDANAGGETYGAGRYLEVEELEHGRLRVDFNYAYNPYCAYNEAWSCPIPPAENRLAVPIRAGERTFEADH